MEKIRKSIEESIITKEKILADATLIQTVKNVIDEIVSAYKKGNKVLAAGNGGSAADAQHFIAEFVGRFYYDRPSLPGIAFTTDTSVLTAIGNDYGYDYIFARQVEGNGVAGDIFIGISTSGNSESIVKAIESANSKGIVTVGLTGAKDSRMDKICDYIIKIPSIDTPRIQEGHALLEHIICELVEEAIFPRKN